jgi:RNA polymerase sigma-70 factor (ECF subfamily)
MTNHSATGNTVSLCEPAAPGAAGDAAGRKREFEHLLDPLLDGLYGAALRMTRNREDAEDLLQDTVLRAFRFFDRFERGTNFKAWALRMMTNLYINQYHKAARQGERVDLEDVDEFSIYAELYYQAGCSHPADPCEQVLAKLGEETIRAAIDALPPDFRLVVTLADVEGLSYEEIAQAAEIPVGTVKSRLYRGRHQVQKLLWAYAQEQVEERRPPRAKRPGSLHCGALALPRAEDAGAGKAHLCSPRSRPAGPEPRWAAPSRSR